MRLRAKYTPPDARGLLPRPGLAQRLDGAAPIAWVMGPPGAGKTSLAASHISRAKVPWFWFQLDGSDGDPAVLFAGLTEGLRLRSRKRRLAVPAFDAMHDRDLQAFARRFFQAAFEQMPAGTIWVLDNYHEMAEGSPSHGVIREAFGAMPADARFLVLSRTLPPPMLVRFQAEGKLETLGWDDLRMTEAESQAMLRQRLPIDFGEARIQEMICMADGWPAGLVLMAAENRLLPREEPGTLSRELLFDYLATEVLDAASPDMRALLLQTSVFPRFTAGQASRLMDRPSVDGILRLLSRSGYFTLARGHQEPVYEYHPLFLDFLRRKARGILGMATCRDLARKAARMMEDDGQPYEAFEGYREAQDWEAGGALIKSQAASMLERGQYRTLLGWLDSLPFGNVEGDAWLELWKGMSLMAVDLARGRQLVEQAFARFEGRGDEVGQAMAWCAVVDSWLFAWDDYTALDRWIDWMDQKGDMAARIEIPGIRESVSVSMLWALVHRKPTHPQIMLWVRRAEQILREGTHPRVRLRAGTGAFMHRFWAGEQAACERLIREVNRQAQALREPLALITSYWVEAGMLTWTGQDANRCRSLIARGLEEGARDGVHLFDFMFHGHAAALAVSEGDLPGAKVALEAMEQGLQGRNSRAFYHYLASWEAWLGGRPVEAVAHARDAVACSEADGMPSSEAMNRLALADLLFEMGQPQAAQEQEVRIAALIPHLGAPVLDMLFHLGMARRLGQSGDRSPRLRTHLQAGLSIGQQYGFTNHLWHVPAWSSQICLLALELETEPAFARRWIEARNLLPPRPPLSCPEWPWPLKITTLGRFTIHESGRERAFPAKGPRMVLTLLKALVAAGPSGIRESRLADEVWPDSEGDAAKQNLDTTLHRLRRLLGVEGAIVLREGRLSLDPSKCWVDAHAFEVLAVSSEASRRGQALALYGGPFLEDEGDSAWVLRYRDHLQAMFEKLVVLVKQRV